MLKKLSITSGAKKCDPRIILLWWRQSQKFGRARHKNMSVGGHLSFARAANSKKKSVSWHFCFGRTCSKIFRTRQSRKNRGPRSFVLQSPQLQKNWGRLSLLLRSRQSQIYFCRRNLCFGHASRKTFCRARRKKALVGDRSSFGHLSCRKKAVRGLFCFGRANHKNFGRWGFSPRSRQLLKWFNQRSHVLLLNQSKQNFGWLTLVLRPHQLQKFSVAPGKKIGWWSLALRSP